MRQHNFLNWEGSINAIGQCSRWLRYHRAFRKHWRQCCNPVGADWGLSVLSSSPCASPATYTPSRTGWISQRIMHGSSSTHWALCVLCGQDTFNKATNALLADFWGLLTFMWLPHLEPWAHGDELVGYWGTQMPSHETSHPMKMIFVSGTAVVFNAKLFASVLPVHLGKLQLWA